MIKVDQVIKQIESIQKSNRFRVVYSISSGLSLEDYEEVESQLKDLFDFNYKIAPDFREAFSKFNGFDLSWQLLETRITGILKISIIDLIYITDEEVGDRKSTLTSSDRPFDCIWEENQVKVRFNPNGSYELIYYINDKKSYTMSINLIQYMSAAFDCLGLYEWQKFFLLRYDLDSTFIAAFTEKFKVAFPDALIPNWVIK